MSWVTPAMVATMAPPVMEARRWIDGLICPDDRPLLNLSQAAPVDPPPEPLRQATADALLNDASSHLYGPVLGLPSLRDELAAQWSKAYGGAVSAGQVAITAGCNQAFVAAMATIAGAGDAVILPTPWYFNHKMWLDMAGIETQALPTGADLMPDPDHAAALITDRTRAIALISPNNPAGVEYPPDLIAAFHDLARKRGIVLILDETYRDFLARDDRPHALFERSDWDESFVHLYSFSKSYRLTGHRVGALVTSPGRLAEVEKFLDTVSICPPQIGQIAALYGMQNLGAWLAGERREVLARRAALEAAFARLEGWEVLGVGAYFAYIAHPYTAPSDAVAKALVDQASLLILPGTMFGPDGDELARRSIRLAFANADAAGLQETARRLAELSVGTDLPRRA